ncbi:glycosyltransferase [Pseudoalteromonas 'SMAR']|uniref:glycosyltransferase n=1 Tax=Pseudoalteromonas 'SMAR' TaxID=3416908 RepID=UPI003AF1EE62
MTSTYQVSLRNVYIYANADEKAGHGHVIRQLSLAVELRRLGFSVKFLYLFMAESIKSKLDYAGFEFSKVSPKSLLNIPNQGDWLIMDDYNLAAIGLSKNTKTNYFVAGVDDGVEYSDFLFDLVIAPSNVLTAKFRAKRRMQGEQFRLIRNEITNAKVSKRYDKHSSQLTLTVMLGATDVKNLQESVLKEISSQLSIQNINLISTLTPSHSLTDLMTSLKDIKVNYYQSPDHLGELMSSSDIAVCGAGGTLYEFLCLGVPTVAVVLAENQQQAELSDLNNHAYYCVNALKNEAKAISDVSKYIKSLSANPSLREKMAVLGMNSVPGTGAQLIAQALAAKSGSNVSSAKRLVKNQKVKSIEK